MADIFHYFNIKTQDTTKIFEAVNSVPGIKGWWTTGTRFKDGVYEFAFTETDKEQFKIIETIENSVVKWEAVKGHKEWQGTKVEFRILPKTDGTTDLSFRHYNWKEQSDFYGVCNYHWGLYLRSLKKYIETGTGSPHQY